MDRDSEDLFLGKKALDRKLITPAQLRDAMIKQAGAARPEGSEPPRLGDILIENNILTRPARRPAGGNRPHRAGQRRAARRHAGPHPRR